MSETRGVKDQDCFWKVLKGGGLHSQPSVAFEQGLSEKCLNVGGFQADLRCNALELRTTPEWVDDAPWEREIPP